MAQPMEGHTVRRYDGELSSLHLLVLEMGGLVIDQTRRVMDALRNKDPKTAREVIEREAQVDALELKADDEIVSLLARRGPMARDLRIVVALSKTVTDLERVGDEAARIAYVITSIYEGSKSGPSKALLRDVRAMGKLALQKLQDGLEVIDTLDDRKAETLLDADAELDEEFQASLRRLTTFVLEDARNVGHAINITLVLKALDRIGEHAGNLAEYVVFLVRGQNVRHPPSTERKDDDNGDGG
jgi:phosphate transport system protein